MIRFTLPLNKEMQRPVVIMEKWHNIDAMIDTGSLFPVWLGTEYYLLKTGAKLHKEHVKFGGFGGLAEGRVYIIPEFCFGELKYSHLYIIANKQNLPCQMILPATMFSGLRYEIDDENHEFNVTVPDNEPTDRDLIIKDKNGRLQVLCTSHDTANDEL
jgi:hypothetical protein